MGPMRRNVAAAFSVRRSCQGQAPLHQASVARTSTAVGDRGAGTAAYLERGCVVQVHVECGSTGAAVVPNILPLKALLQA